MSINFEDILKAKERYNWTIILGDRQKNPSICGPWKDLKTQTTDELRTLYEQVKTEAFNWGPICGIGDLFSIDFDWPFVYRLWYEGIGEAAQTLTYETPNGGARVFFTTNEETQGDPFKEVLHTELKKNHYVAVGGSALTQDGDLQKYELFRDYPIRNDNKIIEKTVKLLVKLAKTKFKWVRYKCIAEHFARCKKRPTLSHRQALAINLFMIADGCTDEEIHHFRRNIFDYKNGRYVIEYNERATDAQIKSGRDFVAKGGKPFPCKPTENNEGLAAIFGFDANNCDGCLRRLGKKAAPKTTEERRSQADKMVELALETKVMLFHDQRKDPYIRIYEDDHFVNHRLRSIFTRSWLAGQLWKAEGKAPGSEALQSALNVLEAIANEGETVHLWNRVAPDGDSGIWLDMADEKWRAIHITEQG